MTIDLLQIGLTAAPVLFSTFPSSHHSSCNIDYDKVRNGLNLVCIVAREE
jgi:hypothetical protein